MMNEGEEKEAVLSPEAAARAVRKAKPWYARFGAEIRRLWHINPYADRNSCLYLLDHIRKPRGNPHNVGVEPCTRDIDLAGEMRQDDHADEDNDNDEHHQNKRQGHLRLAFVGDIQPHKLSRQVKDAHVRVDQSLWDVIHSADFFVGNLECSLVGDDFLVAQHSRLADLHTRVSTLRQLVCDEEAGLGLSPDCVVLNMANNHSFDGMMDAPRHTFERGRALGFHMIGYRGGAAVADDGGDHDAGVDDGGVGVVAAADTMATVVQRHGVRVAFVAVTTLVNGNGLDELDNDLVWYGAEQVLRADWVSFRHEKRVDVLVVSIHFGWENHYFPNTQQVTLAPALIQAGFDIVWGHGPHVWQPVQLIAPTAAEARGDEAKEAEAHGKAESRPGLIMYSTGNFVASGSTAGPATAGGVMMVDILVRPAKWPVSRHEFYATSLQNNDRTNNVPTLMTANAAGKDVARECRQHHEIVMQMV